MKLTLNQNFMKEKCESELFESKIQAIYPLVKEYYMEYGWNETELEILRLTRECVLEDPKISTLSLKVRWAEKISALKEKKRDNERWQKTHNLAKRSSFMAMFGILASLLTFVFGAGFVSKNFSIITKFLFNILKSI